MTLRTTARRRGFTLLEVMVVVAAAALLLGMGYLLWGGVRQTARIAVAESNLKQISTAMELYFREYNSYPPQGSDLTVELAPFVDDPRVFSNPLRDDKTPGETINALYVQPTTGELDSPGHYVTAMVSSNGKTALILNTGHEVRLVDSLCFIPDDLSDSLAAILDPPDGLPGGPGEEQPSDRSVRGLINLNPRNNSDFEFVLEAPDGTLITRDDLHASNGGRTYTGPANWIRVCPKGNGNQNSLNWGGEPYRLRNGRIYTIDGQMSVHLYNVKSGNGKAMGRWWIEINADEAAIIEKDGPGAN